MRGLASAARTPVIDWDGRHRLAHRTSRPTEHVRSIDVTVPSRPAPVVIPASLARWFPATIRARGDAYATSRKCQVISATATRLLALVTGTEQYAVEISARRNAVDLFCSCPYAADSGACKHLWAVLVQCDADGTLAPLLTTAGTTPVVTLAVFDDDESDFDEDGIADAMDDEAVDEPPDAAGSTPAAWSRTQPAPLPARGMPPARRPPVTPVAPWIRVLDRAREQMQQRPASTSGQPSAVWPEDRRLVYILDLEASATSDGVTIDVGTERRDRAGEWGEAKRFTLGAPIWFAAPEPVDRQIAELLCGSDDAYTYGRHRTMGLVIAPRAFNITLRAILDTGRCRLRSGTPGLTGRTLRHDDGAQWTFRLRVHVDAAGAQQLSGMLARDGTTMALGAPLLLHPSGYLIADDAVARFEHGDTFPLLQELRAHGGVLPVPGDIGELLTRIYALPSVPVLELPADVAVIESHDPPVPSVSLTAQTTGWQSTPVFTVACEFIYGAQRVAPTAPVVSLFDATSRRLHHRQRPFERDALGRLRALGVKEEWNFRLGATAMVIGRTRLTYLALALVREGWRVSVEGVRYTAPGAISASVRSGIDWFDLRGTVRYGDTDVPIATILDARRRGLAVVPIADGAMGLMPDEWLDRLGPLIAAGNTTDGAVRFRREQIPLLDALLATLPEADLDATFAKARTQLASFDRVAPANPPRSFRGTLREYQREGLGWMHFLRKFNLGGCLADDMGLGKTVQVLALLDKRRVDGHGPSIVVVPRSLVFNWLREAERFAPRLRMLDYSGSDRSPDSISAGSVDVVVVTYGSLRRDAPMLAGIMFDYAILDEAQAIKNATTATAKASRLLRAQHRLAISGTPIENRIAELWSLLEFLNPGMLGASTKFAAMVRRPAMPASESSRGAATEVDALLARALRPLILRRTKAHVAPELPERVEQTLEVEMEPKQRSYYDSIRALARQQVMARVEQHGIQKSQLHILEALLRLRQAACHPALIDPSKSALPSAKLDALIPALVSIAAEGNKALVFSQFTGFLSLVRERLDASGIRYAYLDGRTRDRQARVDEFQRDAACPVFLISLKAGGHGLNLTAAEYVYLLDPWWNPAVEAQAIDRAHRIGQSRRVIATRLVARDTIEAKILQLQATKRALADAVLTADRGGLASIGRRELELLLGEGEMP